MSFPSFFPFPSLGKQERNGAEGKITPKLKVRHLYKAGVLYKLVDHYGASENRRDTSALLNCRVPLCSGSEVPLSNVYHACEQLLSLPLKYSSSLTLFSTAWSRFLSLKLS